MVIIYNCADGANTSTAEHIDVLTSINLSLKSIVSVILIFQYLLIYLITFILIEVLSFLFFKFKKKNLFSYLFLFQF